MFVCFLDSFCHAWDRMRSKLTDWIIQDTPSVKQKSWGKCWRAVQPWSQSLCIGRCNVSSNPFASGACSLGNGSLSAKPGRRKVHHNLQTNHLKHTMTQRFAYHRAKTWLGIRSQKHIAENNPIWVCSRSNTNSKHWKVPGREATLPILPSDGRPAWRCHRPLYGSEPPCSNAVSRHHELEPGPKLASCNPNEVLLNQITRL